MPTEGLPCEPSSGPFALGEGPFRVRGTVLTGAVDRVEKRVPGGLDAVCASIGVPAVTAFFRETIFLASSLYDIVPLIHLVRAVARVSGVTLEGLVRGGARSAAERDVQSLYRAQMKSATAEEMAARLPRIFNRYFEPTRATGHSVRSGLMETSFEGVPAAWSGYYVWSNEGFIEGALSAAGAREIRAVFGPIVPDGEVSGVPVVRTTVRVSWSTSVP